MSVLGNGNEHCFPINDLVYSFMEESGSKKEDREKRWSKREREREMEMQNSFGREEVGERERVRERKLIERGVTRGKTKVDSD